MGMVGAFKITTQLYISNYLHPSKIATVYTAILSNYLQKNHHTAVLCGEIVIEVHFVTKVVYWRSPEYSYNTCLILPRDSRLS